MSTSVTIYTASILVLILTAFVKPVKANMAAHWTSWGGSWAVMVSPLSRMFSLVWQTVIQQWFQAWADCETSSLRVEVASYLVPLNSTKIGQGPVSNSTVVLVSNRYEHFSSGLWRSRGYFFVSQLFVDPVSSIIKSHPQNRHLSWSLVTM